MPITVGGQTWTDQMIRDWYSGVQNNPQQYQADINSFISQGGTMADIEKALQIGSGDLEAGTSIYSGGRVYDDDYIRDWYSGAQDNPAQFQEDINNFISQGGSLADIERALEIGQTEAQPTVLSAGGQDYTQGELETLYQGYQDNPQQLTNDINTALSNGATLADIEQALSIGSGATNPNSPIQIQQRATDEAKGYLQDILDETKTQYYPYINAGRDALAPLQSLAGDTYGDEQIERLEDADLAAYTQVDYDSLRADPQYQWAFDQAQEAANRNLAAQGMTGSRYAVDSLADVGMRVAQSEQDRVYGRKVDELNRGYQQNMDLFNMKNQQAGNQFDQYSSLAGLGQNTLVNAGNVAANYAGAYGDLVTGMANAQASNILSTNALNQQLDANEDQAWMKLAGTALSSLANYLK